MKMRLCVAALALLLTSQAQAFFFCFSFGGGSRPHAGPWRASPLPPPYPPFPSWPPAGYAAPAYDPGQWLPLAAPPAMPRTATPAPAPEISAPLAPAAKP